MSRCGWNNVQVTLLSVACFMILGCGDASQETKKSPPPTLDGTWIPSGEQTGLHVAKIQIGKTEFPCEGSLVCQYGGGQAFVFDVTWAKQDDNIIALWGEGEDKKEIGRAHLDGSTLAGTFNSPVKFGNESKVSFSNLTKENSAK